MQIKNCKNCNLCNNQRPLLDHNRKADVFWIGLSAVKVSNCEEEKPLSERTNTGKLISTIEKECDNISYYKTNLVKCLPLEKDKIRYPNKNEMRSCYENLKKEIQSKKPKIVFLLGKLVADFVLNKEKSLKPTLDENFEYMHYDIDGVKYVPVHHPSYMLVYKRKKVDNYVKNIKNLTLHYA